mgnify:CR=1
MNADELRADITGSMVDEKVAGVTIVNLGQKMECRGWLPREPCRFCHKTGGVYFVVDDSPFGRNTPQVTACDICKNNWTAECGLVPAT